MSKWLMLALLGALCACGQSAQPEAAAGDEQQAVRFFDEACVQNIHSWQAVALWAKQHHWAALPPEQAAQFVPQGGANQQVWQNQDAGSNRMLLWHNEQGCTLAVRYAHEDAVRQAFTQLAMHPRSLSAHMQADYHSDTPFAVNYLLYAWQDLSTASPREFLLQATTSPSEKAPMQAVLNIYQAIAPGHSVIANP